MLTTAPISLGSVNIALPYLVNRKYIYQAAFIGQPALHCLTVESVSLYYKHNPMNFILFF
jgi:hypothetical protein